MENQNKIQNTNTGKEDKGQKTTEEILRITVSRAAEEALVGIVDRVNDGYEGGKVNRTQIANWVLIRAQETMQDNDIKDIRAEHLDEFAFMEALVRKAKKSGKLPSELRSFMNKQLGLDDAPKKRKKNLQDNAINDDIANDSV